MQDVGYGRGVSVAGEVWGVDGGAGAQRGLRRWGACVVGCGAKLAVRAEATGLCVSFMCAGG